MKRVEKRTPSGLLAFLLLWGAGSFGLAEVVTYPKPSGLVTSFDFSVTVNGQRVWTEQAQSTMDIHALPDWFLGEPYTRVPQTINIASFSCSGPLSVKIKSREPIITYVIRPKSRKIKGSVNGSELTFELPGPDKLYIEINQLAPFCLFADPLEGDAPGADSAGVRYFGPGVHEAGVITLHDGERVYIAGGAVVYGAIRGNPKNARVFGRGILDAAFKQRAVILQDAENVEFNGITIRNSSSWTNTLINCRDVTYRDVKVISFGPGGDGINPLGSRNVTIENCFLRCTDDCIAIKAPASNHVVDNIRVENNTMVGFAFSDGVTIGFETNGPSITNVFVRDCDILIARGGSRVDGHSAFSVICDGPAVISNVHFENLRVEENVPLKLFELQVTDGTKYDANPPGHIRGIELKNISWEVARPIVLVGFDKDHLVEEVTFENCTVGGQPLSERRDLMKLNEFARDIAVR